ncbi:MAG: hypothetical protein ACQEV7_09320 [Bacillota bacterium]
MKINSKQELNKDFNREEDGLENYRDNIGMLLEKIRDEIAEANKSK